MKFIHSADWHIGKVFKQFGAKEENLRRARLDAIENIGHLAINEGISYVLVAGDVYDSEVPSELTLHAPLERMKLFPKVHWHVLPGNHDPHRPRGIWERAAKAGLPANVNLHLDPRPVQLGREAVLLPAPLTRKSEVNDITAWMDRAETPPGLVRIGLTHGAIAGFTGRVKRKIRSIPRDRSRRGSIIWRWVIGTALCRWAQVLGMQAHRSQTVPAARNRGSR